MSLKQTIDNIAKILATASGRDKIAKTLHYMSRIVKWHFEKNGDKGSAERTEKFRQAIGNSRRVNRRSCGIPRSPPNNHDYQLQISDLRPYIRHSLFFSWAPYINSMNTALFDKKNAEPDPMFRSLLLFADFCDGLYYISDNLTYMVNYGIIKMSDKAVDVWDNIIGSWTWLFSVLIWIAYDYRNYLRLKHQHRKLLKSDDKSTEEIKNLEDQIYNYKLNFIKNFADLQLAIYFCFPNSWPSQWVGAFGTINALTGLYQMWPKN